MKDISNLALGGTVISDFYGIGKVIACDEKPEVAIKFPAETRKYTNANCQSLEEV